LHSIKNSSTNNKKENLKKLYSNMIEHYLLPTPEDVNPRKPEVMVPDQRDKNLTDDQF